MAKINFSGSKSKHRILLDDCQGGDIVKIGNDIYIIHDISSFVMLINLETGEMEELEDITSCELFVGELNFCKDDFKDFI
jgi:hypothetical protein